MIYRFRRDWKVLAMTLAVVLLTVYVIYDVYFVGGDMADRIVTPIVFAVIWFLALRTPRYFYIEKDRIVVQFFIGHKVLDDIQSVRPILKGELKGNIKTWGNGGLMGYTGHFENRYIGKYQMYAVNKNELALVTLNNGAQYVINYPRELFEIKKDPSVLTDSSPSMGSGALRCIQIVIISIIYKRTMPDGSPHRGGDAQKAEGVYL